jgi:hypothetical protein
MSKFNIDITPNLWYLVNENKTYYFFEHDKSPIRKITDEQREYIKEMYDNNIDGSKFLYKEIISSRRHIEKQGLALCLDGFCKSSSFFPVMKLNDILQEPVQRIRNFETVICINDGRGQGNDYSYFNNGCGYILFDFDFCIMRRAINDKATRQYNEHNRTYRTDKKIRDIYYDYYKIPLIFDPDDENCVNYIPLEKDLNFTKSKELNMIIISYTKEKYIRLKEITEQFDKLGIALREFMVSDMKKLLPYFQDKRAIGVDKKKKGEDNAPG